MAKLNVKSQLIILKVTALKARNSGQLPFYLTNLIYQLNGKEETKYVQFLMEMSKHLLRVKGYYKQYPFAEKESENLINDGLSKLGYSVN